MMKMQIMTCHVSGRGRGELPPAPNMASKVLFLGLEDCQGSFIILETAFRRCVFFLPKHFLQSKAEKKANY